MDVTATDHPPGFVSRLAACAVIGAAVAGGAAVTTDLTVGLGIVAAAIYATLAFVNLRVAIALLVPLLFLEAVPVFNLAAKGAAVVVLVAWIAASAVRSTRPAYGGHRWPSTILVLLLAWLALSLTWADDVGHAASALAQWLAVGLVFLLVATTMVDMQAIRLTSTMFVIGAVASMAIGVARGELRPLASPGLDAGRFAGAAGDPNLLAAGFLPAIVLALGLLPVRRDPIWRWGIMLSAVLLSVGLAATGSRGGLVAALVTTVLAALLMSRRRKQVLVLATVASCAALVWFSMSPATWKRVTTSDGGAGRDELWKVAWAMAGDHPVAGVGVDNFTVVAGDYTRRVGPLESVDLIAVRPHQVHNVYLQMLAEVGVVGFLLFTSFVLVCIWTGLSAARRFAARGEGADAALAGAVALATSGMLVASFFLSNAVDRRLWFLLALGPGLLTAATTATPIPSSTARSLTARSYSSGVPMSYQRSRLRYAATVSPAASSRNTRSGNWHGPSGRQRSARGS
jgi:O-antigen ligase